MAEALSLGEHLLLSVLRQKKDRVHPLFKSR